MAASITAVPAAHAGEVSSGYWETDGSPVSSTPAPAGSTGSFVLGNLSSSSGVSGSENSQGQITVYYDSSTHFYSCDSTGNNCTASSESQVVQPGGSTVYAEGRYYATTGGQTLLAEYVFSPPPAPSPPPPAPTANPQPTSAKDLDLSDIYGVQGLVIYTKQNALQEFSVGKFFGPDPYGCGTQTNCRVQQIAAAHSNLLAINPDSATNLWLGDSNGCNFQKVSSLLSVLQPGTTNGVYVNGHYTWTGTDWTFFASNIFEPPPAAPGSCPNAHVGLLPINAQFAETNQGVYDSSTGQYQNTVWSGQTSPNDSSWGNGGSATMTLTFQEVGSVWEFWGTYLLTSSNGSTIGGSINGTAPASTATGSVSGQATVDNTSGQYAGWGGSGRFGGTATYISPASPMPPTGMTGTFTFNIQPPA